MMQILFAPLIPFVGYPVRCAVVAGIGLALAAWLLCARRRNGGLMLVGGVAWALFAIWEWYCRRQGYNIRVEMFVVGPVMIALTLGMIVVAFQAIWDVARGVKQP